MPLENLYTKSDETARRWRSSVCLIFFGLAIYFGAAFIYFLSYKTENQKRLEAADREKSVDALCREIRLPSSLVWLRRDEATTVDETTTVVYKYRSYFRIEEIPLQRLRFIEQFDKAGWRSAGAHDLNFARGSQTVALRENPSDFANFELHCSETQTPFDLF